ncbi:helix-turn-helix transcriptional regulator [Marinactinospora rubrisoli]|uniref:Helix-turn-helix transcriptional regulator n=1 Tax=Marinactinospora rubrisoli TaxID=2715399 RepID=A0ABW2KQ33_9ACTN
MMDNLLTSKDIAGLIGVKLETVHRYRVRGDLPEPDGRMGNSPVWRKETIDAWIASRRGHGWRKGQTAGE